MTARLLLAVCMTSQSETSITHSPYRLLTRYPHSERIPLLQSAAPVAHIKGSPTLAKAPQVVTAFTTGPITTDMAASRTLYTLGWAEHVLPDSSVYYYHATRRVSTDIDLRNPRFLQHVTEYLEKTLPRQTTIPPPAGWELWLKSVPLRKEGRTEQSWVNHKLRILTSEPPPSVSGDGLILERFSEDDRESLFTPPPPVLWSLKGSQVSTWNTVTGASLKAIRHMFLFKLKPRRRLWTPSSGLTQVRLTFGI